MFLPHSRVKVSIVGSLRDREVAYSASDRQGSNVESCVWRTVSSHSSHHPQEVLLVQFSLYVHKGGLKPDSFHFRERCCYPNIDLAQNNENWNPNPKLPKVQTKTKLKIHPTAKRHVWDGHVQAYSSPRNLKGQESQLLRRAGIKGLWL